MNQYKHLLAFDLSSYGAGLALINQFADGESVRDFELSPCGTGAQLLLLGKEQLPLEIILKSARALIGSQILDASLTFDIHEKLLPTYLSQNKTAIQGAVLILEGNSCSKAIVMAQNILLSGAEILDFRVLRTFPKNVIITATGFKNSGFENFKSEDFKQVIIERPENSLRSFFEI